MRWYHNRCYLDEQAAPLHQLAPGVRKQTLTSGVAINFKTPQPIRFAQDQVVFVGRRGGIRIDTAQKTARLVLPGGTADRPWPIAGFTGWMGGVAVFNQALTGEEIKRLDELIPGAGQAPRR